MPNIDVCGLVTREVKYGENSRILTVLAKDLGKISILAGRARTNRSGLLTATQLFSYSNFVLFKGREGSMLKLNEGAVINSFSNIRMSLDKMAYASYFCDIANHICADGAEENGMLRLLLNVLYRLAEDDGTEALKLEAIFLFRALMEAGFAPDCDGCASCGSRDKITLLQPQDGVFLCGNCMGTDNGMQVNTTIYRTIDYIVNSSLSRVFSFSLGQNSMKYLAELGEEYMKMQLEKDLKTLDYLKKVRTL